MLLSGVFFILINMLIGIFWGCLGRLVNCINILVWLFIVFFMLIIFLE